MARRLSGTETDNHHDSDDGDAAKQERKPGISAGHHAAPGYAPRKTRQDWRDLIMLVCWEPNA